MCNLGAVSTIAGGSMGYLDGSGSNARFSNPSAIAIDRSVQDIIYVTDNNYVIRRMTREGKLIRLR